ncbi:MAG: hypothetical protein ACRDMW_04145 [Gaiellaceae bacterium]
MAAGSISAPRIPRPPVASRPFFALGTVVLLATLAGPIPDRHGLVLGALCAVAGAARWSWDAAVLRGLRRTANDALVQGARPERSPLLSWRAAELTSAFNRRSLARSLRGVVRDSTARISISASPVNRQAARGEVEAIERLATRLRDLDHPAEPRGILLVEDLLTDGFGPLYARERASDLGPALDRCLAALDAESLQR